MSELKVGNKVIYCRQILEVRRVTVDDGLLLSNGRFVCANKVKKVDEKFIDDWASNTCAICGA